MCAGGSQIWNRGNRSTEIFFAERYEGYNSLEDIFKLGICLLKHRIRISKGMKKGEDLDASEIVECRCKASNVVQHWNTEIPRWKIDEHRRRCQQTLVMTANVAEDVDFVHGLKEQHLTEGLLRMKHSVANGFNYFALWQLGSRSAANQNHPAQMRHVRCMARERFQSGGALIQPPEAVCASFRSHDLPIGRFCNALRLWVLLIDKFMYIKPASGFTSQAENKCIH